MRYEFHRYSTETLYSPRDTTDTDADRRHIQSPNPYSDYVWPAGIQLHAVYGLSEPSARAERLRQKGIFETLRKCARNTAQTAIGLHMPRRPVSWIPWTLFAHCNVGNYAICMLFETNDRCAMTIKTASFDEMFVMIIVTGLECNAMPFTCSTLRFRDVRQKSDLRQWSECRWYTGTHILFVFCYRRKNRHKDCNEMKTRLSQCRKRCRLVKPFILFFIILHSVRIKGSQ